jgi:hypothetical protein
MLDQCPWLDGKHVVFGKVLEGQEVVAAMEAVGSGQGAPRQEVRRVCTISNINCVLACTYCRRVHETTILSQNFRLRCIALSAHFTRDGQALVSSPSISPISECCKSAAYWKGLQDRGDSDTCVGAVKGTSAPAATHLSKSFASDP